jgi:hypothetical protein
MWNLTEFLTQLSDEGIILPINHQIKQVFKNILITPLVIKQPLSQNIEAKKLCNCCISIEYLMKISISWKLPDRA